MVEHRNLTGASLHEPKGVETATLNEVYHADGVGSGSWSDPLSRVNNLNVFTANGVISDVSTAGSNVIFYIPFDCTLTDLSTVLYGSITVANSILSLYRNGVLLGQTLTIDYTGSALGVTDTITFSPTYAFTAGQTLEIRSDGGSTTAMPLAINLVFTAT